MIRKYHPSSMEVRSSPSAVRSSAMTAEELAARHRVRPERLDPAAVRRARLAIAEASRMQPSAISNAMRDLYAIRAGNPRQFAMELLQLLLKRDNALAVGSALCILGLVGMALGGRA